MNRTLTVRTAVAAVLLAAPAAGAMAGASASYAAGETCGGKPATIVVTDASTGTASGTDGPDVVVVATASPLLFNALAGDDTVCGGAATSVNGGDGNDAIDLGAATAGVDAGGGAGNDTILGGPAADELWGGPGDDVISAGAGDDKAAGGAGSDQVAGGDGNDFVSAHWDVFTPAADIDGAEGTDVGGHDTTDGGAGDDYVLDGPDDDAMGGGDGADVMTLSRLYPQFYDTVNDDCENVSDTPVHVSVSTSSVTGIGTDTFSGFESYHGGEYPETFTGSPGPDQITAGYCGTTKIHGWGGADSISIQGCHAVGSGNKGADDITFHTTETGRASGGRGDDTITVPFSDDFGCQIDDTGTVVGGRGTDLLHLPEFAGGVLPVVNLHQGFAGTPVRHEFSLHALEDVTVDGAPFNGALQVLVGNDGPNVLIGGPSKHTQLWGRSGADTLIGRGADDDVDGGPGRDRCRGAEHRHHCEG